MNAAPLVQLKALETLWVNTGTLCNITCVGCFMESSPTNDALGYFSAVDLADILVSAPAGVQEVGFTGGEPFMNPEIMEMLHLVLARGLTALVLTNAMRPLQRHIAALKVLAGQYPGRLKIRVSLDHYSPEKHEELRGERSFAATLEGLRMLAGTGVVLAVASRTVGCETQAARRAGFAALFGSQGVALDAADPGALVLFPEMDPARCTRPVSAEALCAAGPPMCATSRMVVRRAGAVEIAPCTLLPGRALAGFEEPARLDHAFCAQFCVDGGASCSGARV